MESSSFSGGHIRIRKLKLKSGAGPESLCFKLQRQAVLWLVRLGILSQCCCYWELGTEVHSPRCGIHIPLRCCPLPSGRVPEGCSKLATPNPYPVLGQFLRFGVSCNVPSHFTPGASSFRNSLRNPVLLQNTSIPQATPLKATSAVIGHKSLQSRELNTDT